MAASDSYLADLASLADRLERIRTTIDSIDPLEESGYVREYVSHMLEALVDFEFWVLDFKEAQELVNRRSLEKIVFTRAYFEINPFSNGLPRSR